MAKKIKGITIEIGGETRALDKALEDVNKKTRDLQSELRSVERLLKLDPKNTELLAQKQKLLADQVENSREKLERLRAAQEKVEEAFRKGEIGEEQYRHFQRQVINAEQELKKFEKQLRETGITAEQLSKKLGDAGKKMTDVGKDLSKKVTAPILGIGTVAAKTGMEFEAAMSKVQALSGATAEEMAKLEKQAREMGAATVFSASEAAEAQAFLAMAGYDVAQIMDSLPGLLNLAAAGQLDLGRAADITTNIMSGFNIEAEKTTQVADVLAKAAASANTSVEQMGDAMSYVAPVAAGAGISLEETAAAIGILSNAGIQGQRAGTALRGIIASLQNPTGQTAKALEALGLTADDVNPSMHSLTDILRTLQEAGIDSAQAMQLAGTAAGPALIAMLSAGSDSLADFTDTLVNADGAAAEMAATMTDNLHGRIQEMKSAFEEAALIIYDNILPALEWLVQRIKALADWFNNLSPTMQNTIIVIAGIAAAIGPLLIVLGQMSLGLSSIIKLIGPLTTGLTGAAGATGGLSAAISALTGPIGVAIAAMTALVAAGVLVYKNWDEIKATLDRVWGAIVDFFTKTIPEAINKGLKTFSELPGKVAKFMNELPGKIGQALGVALGNIIKFGIDAINWAIAEVPKFIESMMKFIRELPGKMWEQLVAALGRVREWGNNLISWARSTLPGVISNIVSFFRELPGRLLEIGKDIVRGLWNGISSMARWIRDKVSDFVGGIVSGVKGVLGIRSPSRVFMDIGENLSLGLAKGIADAKNAVDSALAGLISPQINVGLAGAGSAGMGAITNTFVIQNMSVRSDQDIKLIARELYKLQQANARGRGLK